MKLLSKKTEIITVNISNIANASALAGLERSPTGGGIAIAAGQGYLYAKKADSNGEYRDKKPNSNIKGQKAKDDIPDLVRNAGYRSYKGENGNDFAKRVLNEKYGVGNYKTGAGSEYSKLEKWVDQHFY